MTQALMKNITWIYDAYFESSYRSVLSTLAKSFLPLFLVVVATVQAAAQENAASEEIFRRHHSLALLLGHTQTSHGFVDGEQQWLAMPSWALEYNYHISKRWNIGLHNDIVVETFKVEDNTSHHEVIERTRPISSLIVASYKIRDLFSVELGAGAEFAKQGNFFVSRLGFEYAYQLPKEWEVKANATYDVKWDAYNSFSLGVGLGKAFGFRKKDNQHAN
jgi:hypothetical protein